MNLTVKNFLFWARIVVEVAWVLICLIPELLKEIFYLVVPRKLKDINGQVALVTGAAHGLGRELALELSRHGCTVICVDINEEGNIETSEELVKLGRKSRAYTCDISDGEAVEILASKTGPVDILVNNAGVIDYDPLLETSQDMVSKILEVNVKAQFLMLHAFLPGILEKDSGHIVAIASCAGLTGLANASVYSTSKFAIVGLMESLAKELRLQGRNNINTSCVCPYFMRTIDEIDICVHARIPPIEAVDAARAIVEGVRRNLILFTVPSSFQGLLNINRFFPTNIQNKMYDVFYSTLKPKSTCDIPAQRTTK